MKKELRRNIELGILFGLICAVILGFARFDTRCDELREGVLRLHILANSDSDADQQLKLKVRDRILEVSASLFQNANDINEAIKIAESKTDLLTKEAKKVIKQSGYDYSASVSVEKNFFCNREYEGFTLPAGVYNSLTVCIGESKGHNWWCVVFPGVCLPAAEKAQLKSAVSKSSAKVAQNAKNYKICFKTVEIYEKIRDKIQKN